MARMLYLRDIEVDVLVRCCACGHEGVLPRAMLMRRFGINYPVLAIAPHYRCSHCNSRRVESLPAPRQDDAEHALPAPRGEKADIDGPLAMLQGLLNSVRASAATREAGEERPTEEGPRREAEPPPRAPKPISAADLDALTDMRWEGEEPDAGDEPVPAFKPRVFDPSAAATPTNEAAGEAPLGNTLAALRSILEAEDEEPERPNEPEPSSLDMPARGMALQDAPDEADPPIFSPHALVRDDYPQEDEESEQEDEPAAEDVLGFAIRDPESTPLPWGRNRPAVVEDEPMEKTLETLRDLVEQAAAEPGELAPARKPRPPANRKPAPADPDESRTRTERAADPQAGSKAESRSPAPPTEPDIFEKTLGLVNADRGKTPKAGEPNSFEKTISTLRSMLELDGKRRRS